MSLFFRERERELEAEHTRLQRRLATLEAEAVQRNEALRLELARQEELRGQLSALEAERDGLRTERDDLWRELSASLDALAEQRRETAQKLEILWWSFASYSHTLRRPFCRIEPPALVGWLCAREIAERAAGLDVEPLASLLHETLRRLGVDLQRRRPWASWQDELDGAAPLGCPRLPAPDVADEPMDCAAFAERLLRHILTHAEAPDVVEALRRLPAKPLLDLPEGEAEGGFRSQRVLGVLQRFRRAAKAQEPEIVLTDEQKRHAMTTWARSGPQGPIDDAARPPLDLRVPLVLWDAEQLARLHAFLEATVCEAMRCWGDNPAHLAAAAAVGAIQNPPAAQAPDAAGREAVQRALAEARSQGAPR